MTIEARLDGVSSTLALLVPWQAIAPVIDRFSGRDEQPTTDAEEARPPCGARSAASRSRCGPRSPASHLPIEEVLALQPGDVIDLDAPPTPA